MYVELSLSYSCRCMWSCPYHIAVGVFGVVPLVKLYLYIVEKPKTVYTNARKQLIIYSPPAILTLHLKRFQQNGYSYSKVNRHVEFTINLDLAPYCSSLSQVSCCSLLIVRVSLLVG